MADTYVATEPLYIGRDRAHNRGDEVPADNIKRNGWAAKVAKAGTKAAAEAVEQTEEAPGDSSSPKK